MEPVRRVAGQGLWFAHRGCSSPAGAGRDPAPFIRHRLALRVQPAPGLVGRAGVRPVSVARHAGLGDCISTQRAHAHDRHRRHVDAAPARGARCGRSRRCVRLSGLHPASSHRVHPRRGVHHHADSGYFECVAHGGIANRACADAGVFGVAPGFGRFDARARGNAGRAGTHRRLVLAGCADLSPAWQLQPFDIFCRTRA